MSHPVCRPPAATAIAIGVVIVAHNREALVRRGIQSIYSQDLDAPFELCLVDSASTDGTGETLRQLAEQSPPQVTVQTIFEASGSASRARNAGWQALTAPIVAFLDDDAEAEPDWLRQALAVLDQHSDAHVLAGYTDLRWLGDPPAEPIARAAATFTALDLGDRMRRIHYPQAPIGPNMVFRRGCLEASGGFDPLLGPAPGRSVVCEEGDLSLRLERNGSRIIYAPQLRVHHLTDPQRLTPEHLLARARIHGASRCQVDRKHFGWRRAPGQILRLLRGVVRVLVRRRFTILERIDFAYGWSYFRTLVSRR